ncbi:MAG: hypothetical protein DSY60_05295 [Persephonella sp.]|nr:MAG: hypothetical protein DSY60_05295 [Persephonella sp.]
MNILKQLSLLLFFIIFIPSILSSCWFLEATTEKNETYVARLILDIPKDYTKKDVIDGVVGSIANRCDSISKDKRFFPETLPEKPEKPIMVNVGFGYTFPTCGNAWVEIGGEDTGIHNFLGVDGSGQYRACIYPYKDGYRVYVYANYEISSDAVGSLLRDFTSKVKDKIDSGMNKAFGGLTYVCQDELFNCWFDIVLVNLKEKFPKSKIISIDYPQERRKGGSLSIDKYMKEGNTKESKKDNTDTGA